MNPYTGLTVVAVLVLLEGFFSGSELALVSVDKVQVRAAGEAGGRAMRQLGRFLEAPERILTTTLIGTNVCVVTATTLIALMLRDAGVGHDRVELATVLLGSPVILLFGELLPKSIFQRNADRIAPMVIGPLTVLSTLFSPLVGLVRMLSHGLLRLFNAEHNANSAISRDELRLLLDRGEGDAFEPGERRMIHRVLDFPELTVKEVMRPLIDVVGVRHDATVGEAQLLMVETGYSRLPVFLERVDDITAVLHARDLLHVQDPDKRIDELVHPVPYVPLAQKVGELLEQLQRARKAMAVVVDEYGGAEGIITVEDILEEIVGEIQDEHDEPEPDVLRRGPRDFLVSARIEIDRLNEQLGLDLPEGDYETLGGFLLEAFGRIPSPGSEFRTERAALKVESASSRVVEQVRIVLDSVSDVTID